MSEFKSLNYLKDNYIILSVFSTNENLSKKENFLLLRNFFSKTKDYDGEEAKLGVLLKFNNSLGFKNLTYQPNRDGYGYITNKIDTSDEYITPDSLLIRNMYWLNRENEIVSFIIPLKDIKDKNYSEYNYNTLDLIIRFQSFLNKIYGRNIRTELEFKSDFKLTLKKKVLSYIYITSSNGEYYSCEMSLHRKLKDKEIKYILDVMKNYVTFKPSIMQYFCETCYGYDSNFPYHMEFLKYSTLKELYDDYINVGYGNEIPSCLLEALDICK